MHSAHPRRLGGFPVQQVQEMATDSLILGLDRNAFAVKSEVIPVQKGRPQGRHQLVGNVTGAGVVMVILLRCDTAQNRDIGAHHIHGVRGRWQGLQGQHHTGGQATQRLKLPLIGGQFDGVGQLAVHQKIGDLLKLRCLGEIKNIIAAIGQIIAGPAHRTQGRIASHRPRQGHGFLRFEAGGFRCSISHVRFHFYSLRSPKPPSKP